MHISSELLIQPWQNGVRIIKPEEQFSSKHLPKEFNPNYKCVKEVMQFPFNVFLLNGASEIQSINENNIQAMGFTSLKNAVGKTILSVSKNESALKCMQNDQTVISKNNFIFCEEIHETLEGQLQDYLSIKFPWYDADNKIIGVFGFAITLGEEQINSLTKAMGLISETQIFPLRKKYLSLMNFSINGRNVFISQREKECLLLLLRGKTAKEIALKLNLSPRTIEHYLDQLKIKFAVNKKSELIDIVWDCILIN